MATRTRSDFGDEETTLKEIMLEGDSWFILTIPGHIKIPVYLDILVTHQDKFKKSVAGQNIKLTKGPSI